MNSVISIQNLSVKLGFKEILQQISLEVAQGSICALLGRNGAGKSTLMKTLMNIYPYQKGSATLLGVTSRNLSPKELERIGYVAEGQELPLWMTVSQFLKYCSTFYKNWDDALCRQLLKQMDLPSSAKLGSLSKGMRTKVALVSSLAYRPELLILDEPFNGLDPLVRDEIIAGILELSQDNKLSVFISSHDLAETEQISDSIVFIQEGRTLLQGSLDELLTRFRKVRLLLHEPDQNQIKTPAGWLEFNTKETAAEFVDSQFEESRLLSDIRSLLPKAEVVAIEEMSLKDIYRAVLTGAEE